MKHYTPIDFTFKMPYSLVVGDLLEADTEYIVQQNCCTATKAHGLSDVIAKKWPEINPYKDRKRFRGNWAIPEDRPDPGTILVYEFEELEGKGIKGVVCAFAQYCHGKPGVYKDPLGLDKHDTPSDRIAYFIQCLDAITTLSPKSVGFPHKIGSNLAGGSWDVYEGMIQSWSKKHPEVDVKVFVLPTV